MLNISHDYPWSQINTLYADVDLSNVVMSFPISREKIVKNNHNIHVWLLSHENKRNLFQVFTGGTVRLFPHLLYKYLYAYIVVFV